MKFLKSLIASIAICCIATAQQPAISEDDIAAFDEKIAELQKIELPPGGERIIAVGKTFIGTPYVGKTLEVNDQESLVINLREFDCTTFVENVLAFDLLLSRQANKLDSFGNVLQNIRYREGELNGYASRLHYFTEWIADNEQKGIVSDISEEIGGKPVRKEINFMSAHRDLYPMLKDDESFEQIQNSEKKLSNRTLYFLPKEQIEEAEHLIKSGDILALATSIEGLDVTHTGFAIRQENGRIHLLHASSSGQVEVSEQPLSEYLAAMKHNTGIYIARPQ